MNVWRRYPAICGKIDGPKGHYVKWDKSDREKPTLYIPYMWSLKKQKTKLEKTE